MSKRIVIALGGNALGKTAQEQLRLVTETARPIVDLIEAGNEVVVAHGNGPQVGMINLGLSTAAESGAIQGDMPFPECGAMSQGYIRLSPAKRHRQRAGRPGHQQGRGHRGDPDSGVRG